MDRLWLTSLSFISHSIAVSATTQIHDSISYTIHHCVTEDRNKSHYDGPLCESRKQRAQSVAL